MNCFEWQNNASDHLDGVLKGSVQQEADDHAETCPECSIRYQHYRQILTSISNQPRSALPVPIRKAPMAAILPRLGSGSRRSAWERLPWLMRASIEGVGITAAVLAVIALAPRVRTLYEQGLEDRIDALLRSEPGPEGRSSRDSASVPLTRGNPLPPDTGAVPADSEDFASGDSETDSAGDADTDDSGGEIIEASDGNGGSIHVGNAEVWRFNLKTDSPRDVRSGIIQILNEAKIPSRTPGFGGIEAPGGIQFDMLVAKAAVPILKQRLETLSAQIMAAAVESGNAPESTSPRHQPFTWYKNKSKRKIPSGQARVVIWLSQF